MGHRIGGLFIDLGQVGRDGKVEVVKEYLAENLGRKVANGARLEESLVPYDVFLELQLGGRKVCNVLFMN